MFDGEAFAAAVPRALDADLLKMRDWARRKEVSADAPGLGRNPKARRKFRLQRELAETELIRRGLL